MRKTARDRTMPPLLHLSDIRCKCFPYRPSDGKQITYSEICEFIR